MTVRYRIRMPSTLPSGRELRMYRGRYNDGSPGYTTDTRSEAAGFTCRVIVFDSEEKATEFMVQDPASVTMFKLFVEPFESS